MKVISIGTDRKIFAPTHKVVGGPTGSIGQEGSPVRERQIEYGKLFDRLDIVVFSDRCMNYESRIMLAPNVFAYPTNSRNKLFYIFDAIKIIKGIIHNSNPIIQNTVISVQDPFEIGIVGVLLKMRYGLPLHVQLHTDFNNIYFIKHSVFNFTRFFLAHIVLPYADAVRVVSKKVGDSIKDLNKNIIVLPINVEFKDGKMERWKDLERKEVKILTVARLEKEKDLETAIKAFAQISKKYPEATFTIAGEGSEKSRLQALVNRLKLEDRVKFIGWVEDLDGLYNSHDIYISTSLYEGYGMSVVEAGMHGLALVLSEAGVARELPVHVCKPGDVACFVQALDKLLGYKKLLLETCKNTAMFMDDYVLSKEEYLNRYREAMDKAVGVEKIGFIKAIFKGNKVLRFLIGGGSAAFTQIFFLFIFTDILKLWYIYSSIFSFCLAFIVSFLMQKLWVFQDKGIKGAHVQLIKYIFVGLLGLGINTVLMYIFVSILGLWYILSQVGAGILIAVFNFFAYRKFIFKQ